MQVVIILYCLGSNDKNRKVYMRAKYRYDFASKLVFFFFVVVGTKSKVLHMLNSLMLSYIPSPKCILVLFLEIGSLFVLQIFF